MFDMKRYHISMTETESGDMNKPWPKILLLLLEIFCYIHLTWASNARHSDLNFDEYVVLISREIILF